MDFEIIIVGGGPAGAYAAYQLAQAGREVLLIEKEKLPRYKACGGAISLKVKDFLTIEELKPVIEDKISQIRFNYQEQPPISIDFQQPFVYLVMRDKLDYLLIDKAKKAGAKVIDNCSVVDIKDIENKIKVLTENQEFNTQFIIGADGADSLVARKLALHSELKYAVGWEKEIKVTPKKLKEQTGKIYLDYGAITKGYSWIFPKKDHLSVGIATYKQGLNLKQKLTDYLIKEDITADTLQAKGHLLPVWQKKRKLNTTNGLLIGDAAGLIDPLSGEGIFYALYSAQLASQSILSTLAKKESLDQYTKLINQQITPEFEKAKLLSYCFFWAPKQIHKSLVKKESLLKNFLQVIYGNKSYSDLYKLFISEIPFL
ncbi:geranylgeranyl reductase family protein [Halanaerocella petrolearia]